MGKNLLFFVVIFSFLPHPSYASSQNTSTENVLESPIVLNTNVGVRYPVSIVRVTQKFSFFHPGLDIDGVTGDSIHPILSGRVETVQRSKFGYGNSIVINHGSGTQSLYAHLSKIEVVVGQEVTTDTEIGKMGATGHASGDHLHLEVYEDGKRVNPLSVLPSLQTLAAR